MNETIVTVVGHVATDPAMRTTASGVRVTTFRLASTERRWDRQLSAWRDRATVFFTVTCWRAAAENVYASISKGQPVVVTGRLQDSSYDKDGQHRTVIEIEARAVGHDLTRGVATFTRTQRTAEPTAARDYDDRLAAGDQSAGEEAPDGFPRVPDSPAALVEDDDPMGEGYGGAPSAA